MRWAQRARPAIAAEVRRGPRRDLLRDERGTVTAEFAVVVPAVLVILGLVVGGIVIATNRLTLAAAAADIARLEARGDTDLAVERLGGAGAGVTVERERRGGLLCVTLKSGPTLGMLAMLAVTGDACAVATDPPEIEGTFEAGVHP